MGGYTCARILLFLVQIYGGYFLTMVTQPQRYVVSERESVVLICDFHADHYNLFDYPVLWKKSQHSESTQINIMGNINEPFLSASRFDVSYSSVPPRYRLELVMSDMTAEDSGNYTCEVRGPQSVILDAVTHYVFVRAPVEQLVIIGDNFTTQPSRGDTPGHPLMRRLTLIENTENYLRCTAVGGYPEPELEIKIGRQSLNEYFQASVRPRLSGVKGLRVITYTTELWSHSFMPTKDDDSRKLKCTAGVAGLKPNVTTVRLSVNYSPKISCHTLGAFINEKNVHLTCTVEAKPKTTALFWILNNNGTTLSEGEVKDEFWTLMSDNSDGKKEVSLYMRKATEHNFRSYTLVAENSVAISQREVELYERFRTPAPQPTKPGPPKEPSNAGRRDSQSYTFYYGSASSSVTSRSHLLLPTCLLFYVTLTLLSR